MKTFVGPLIFSIVTVLISQALVIAQVSQSLLWVFRSPFAFSFTVSLLFLATLALQAIFNSLRWATVLLHGLVIGVAGISCAKMYYLGTPLVVWDFGLYTESTSVAFAKFIPHILAGVAALIFVLAAAPFPKTHLSLRHRVIQGVLTTFLVAIVILANNPIHDVFFYGPNAIFQINGKKPQNMYTDDGILVSLVLMKEIGEIFPPADYKREIAAAIYDKYSQVEFSRSDFPRNPDIIVVMSESLFDPLELKGVKWNTDPLAFSRSLMNSTMISNMVVPTFGNKTANSEFEFLTGYSTSFFAKGTIPYMDLIDSPQPSMARTLRDAGYRAIAIHPGSRAFYNRNNVYQHLGFESFLTNDDAFRGAPQFGHQISDESILPVLSQSLNSIGNEPSFHFIVTIQNHFPYTPNAFDLSHPLFDRDTVAPEDQVVLNYYSQLVAETDRFHHRLIEMLEKRKRPTVVLIFGDHLPPLAPSYGVFIHHMISTADKEKWSVEEKQRMHSTPYLVWSNFGYKGEAEPIQTSLAGMRLLRSLNIPLPPFQKFVAEFSDRARLYRPGLVPSPSPELKKDLDDYATFQYSTFVGETPNPSRSSSPDTAFNSIQTE